MAYVTKILLAYNYHERRVFLAKANLQMPMEMSTQGFESAEMICQIKGGTVMAT